MINPANRYTLLFLLLPMFAPAQTKCRCSLDTAKILANENLDVSFQIPANFRSSTFFSAPNATSSSARW